MKIGEKSKKNMKNKKKRDIFVICMMGARLLLFFHSFLVFCFGFIHYFLLAVAPGAK